MKRYTFSVDQIIRVSANSEEEARDLLPMYASGFDGQSYYVKEEIIELVNELEIK
jgi:hypothetical protein